MYVCKFEYRVMWTERREKKETRESSKKRKENILSSPTDSALCHFFFNSLLLASLPSESPKTLHQTYHCSLTEKGRRNFGFLWLVLKSQNLLDLHLFSQSLPRICGKNSCGCLKKTVFIFNVTNFYCVPSLC